MSVWGKINSRLSENSFSIKGSFDESVFSANREVIEQGGFINHYHMLFCGGTSIRNTLIDSLGPGYLNISRFNGLEDLVKLSSIGSSGFEFSHQHYSYPLSLLINKDFVNLIPLRDPVGYFKSSYNKPRSFPGKIVTLRRHALDGFSLEEILDYSVYTSTNNPLSRQIAILHPEFEGVAKKYLENCKRLYLRRGGEVRGSYFHSAYEEQSFYAHATRNMSDLEIKQMAIEVMKKSRNIVCPVKDMQKGFDLMLYSLGFEKSFSIPHVGKSKGDYMSSSYFEGYESIIEEVNGVDFELYNISLRWLDDIYN